MKKKQMTVIALLLVAAAILGVGLYFNDLALIAFAVFFPLPIILLLAMKNIVMRDTPKEAIKQYMTESIIVFIGTYVFLRWVFIHLIMRDAYFPSLKLLPLFIVPYIIFLGWRSYRAFNDVQSKKILADESFPKELREVSVVRFRGRSAFAPLFLIFFAGWIVMAFWLLGERVIPLFIEGWTATDAYRLELVCIWLAFGAAVVWFNDGQNRYDLAHPPKE